MTRPLTLAATVAAVLAALTAGPAARAAEPYTVYENFSTVDIEASRWLQLERTRLVRNGALNMVQRDLGNQLSDTGRNGTTFATPFVGGSAIRQMRADIAVGELTATGCAQNPAPSEASARLAGTFFNAAGTSPGNRTSDVEAQVRVVRLSSDPPGQLRIEGLVLQCTSADCASFTVLGQPGLGLAATGDRLTLQVDWDADNNRFLFYRLPQSQVVVPYALPDTAAPSQARRVMETRTVLANCFSGPRTEGVADVRFDNVQVNQSALP